MGVSERDRPDAIELSVDGVRAQSAKMIEKRFCKRTPVLEIDVFSPSNLQLFRCRVDKFAVEGTPSEDFLEVLAWILPFGFVAKSSPVNNSEEAAQDSCFASDAWIIP